MGGTNTAWFCALIFRTTLGQNAHRIRRRRRCQHFYNQRCALSPVISGAGISHQALLRSDALKSRGVSVGDVCLFSRRAAPFSGDLVSLGADWHHHERAPYGA